MNKFRVRAEFSSFEEVKIMMLWMQIKTPTFLSEQLISNGTIAIPLMVRLTFQARTYITCLRYISHPNYYEMKSKLSWQDSAFGSVDNYIPNNL